MPELKHQLICLLKKDHQGQDRAIKIRDLVDYFRPLHTNDREIRDTLRQLNHEGYPVLTSTNPPYGVYYAQTQDEINEYRANLVSRLTSLKERIEDVEQIRLEPGQMEMFE
jgi:hypothetical protein